MNFPLGCSLCRSEKLELIEKNEKASNGVNIERRQDMKDRFDHVHGHDIGREMRVLKGPQKYDEEGNLIVPKDEEPARHEGEEEE